MAVHTYVWILLGMRYWRVTTGAYLELRARRDRGEALDDSMVSKRCRPVAYGAATPRIRDEVALLGTDLDTQPEES